MIQLSTLPATSAENPAKLAMFAAPEGVFEAMLGEEAAAGRQGGGKILPEGGKMLPDALPVDGFIGQEVPRTAGFSAIEATQNGSRGFSVVAAETADELPEGETELAAAEVADTPETKAPEFEVEPGFSPLPIALMQTIAQADNQAEAPGAPVAGGAASLPSLRSLVEPASQAIGQSEADAESGDGEEAAAKPVHPAASLASPALLAALGRRGDAAADRAAASRGNAAEASADGAVDNELPGPAAAQAPAAKPARQAPARETVLEITREAKPASGEQGVARSQLAAGAPASAQGVTPALPTDAAAPAQGVRPALDSAAHNNSVRPHDLTALVDRLVEARQNARSTTASVTVMHAEFGEVSVRFGQDNGGLTVSLANNDPGFHRAINAAVATDSQPNGDAAAQGGRREDGQPSARTSADSNSPDSERGTGRDRDDRQARIERNNTEQREAALKGRRALGGIFA